MIDFKLFSPRRDRTAAMPFIMLTVLIDMVSIGLIIPVLPTLVGSFTGSPADQAFWYGVVVFAFGIANFFGSPVLGALSDAYGRRPLLLLGFCGLGLSFFVTGLSTALWMLIAVRLVGGAMQANAAVANAYVADITVPEERASRFGMLGAMFGLGFIIGPVMGGLLGAINLQLPFFVAGAFAMINWLYGYFVLPESLPAERRRPFHWRVANPLVSLRALNQLSGVGRLVAVVALSGLAQFVLFTSWVLYTTFKFGWGPRENGWSLAAVGIMSLIVQGFLLGRLLKRFSPRRLAVAGLVSSTLAHVVWGAASQGWMLYAVIFVNVLGYTITASLQSIISGAADPQSQGQTLGAVNSLNSLMAVLAPLFGAPMLATVSHLPRGDWRIGAPFYFCAVLQAASLSLAFFHFRSEREGEITGGRKSGLNTKLRDELLSMQHEDQRVLQELVDNGELGTVEYHPRIKEVHERNNARIKGIIELYGWPGISLVGKEGTEAAWLIVQHAVLDTEFMGSCLELLGEAVRNGEAEGKHFAYLQDRVLTMSGWPQIYGTQHDVDEHGAAFPLPMANPEEVDNLRRKMGLGTLAEATSRIQESANTIRRNREADKLLSCEASGDLCVRNGDSGKVATVFQRLVEIVERSGITYVLHAHAASRTMGDAAQNLSFDVARIVKTIAFRTRNGGLVMAALRGTGRVDYPRLAALVGVNRRDLAPLSPEEVLELLGVEPGSVSPLPLREDAEVLIDDDVLTILPTVYCGIGRPERTLELAPVDLVKLAGGRLGGFSR